MAASIIDPYDFEPIKLAVAMHNLTSRVTVPQQPDIQLLEYEETQFVFGVRKASCATGHQLGVFCQAGYRGNVATVELTGKVTSVEPGDTADRVTLELMQVDHQTLTDFCFVFSRRQRDIVDFFSSVKGS